MNDNATPAAPLFTLRIPRTRAPGDPFAWLASDRGELVLDFASRAVIRLAVGDYMVDSDHLIAQFDARDRFERDAGWSIL